MGKYPIVLGLGVPKPSGFRHPFVCGKQKTSDLCIEIVGKRQYNTCS